MKLEMILYICVVMGNDGRSLEMLIIMIKWHWELWNFNVCFELGDVVSKFMVSLDVRERAEPPAPWKEK